MNSYTVSQLATSHDCGNRAWGLGQGEKIEENWGILLGRQLDTMVEEYAGGITELPEIMTKGLPPLEKILKVQHSFNKDMGGVNLRGRIDLATKHVVIDTKLGEIRPRDRIQMRLYMRALKFKEGEIVQFGYHKKGPDRFTFKQSHSVINEDISDDEIMALSDRIENRVLPEKKIEACKNCHFKTTCPITVGTNELTDKAAEIRHKIGEDMAELESIEKQLKTLPAKDYATKWGSYMVGVTGRRYVTAAALSSHPVKDFKALYADPKPILDKFAEIEGAVEKNETKTLKWKPKEEKE